MLYEVITKSAEAEFNFIEQCAAAGCKGIIGYYNEGRSESIKLAESLGMYYYGEAMNEASYEPAKNSKYYVGGHYTGNGDYDFGRAVAKALVDAGSHRIIVMSGGKEYGVGFFVDRYNGIMDGIKAAADSGYDIKVVLITSYSIHYTKLYDFCGPIQRYHGRHQGCC